MSTAGLTLGGGIPSRHGQKVALFRGSPPVCVAVRGTPLAAAHREMRSTSDRLPSWSRALVVALAAAAFAAAPLSVTAASERRLIPLERMDEISVMVDDMTPDAETLALTREIIQADAESQLLRNGLRVHASGSMPALYFQISVLCDDNRGPCAIDVSSAAVQEVFLEAMATSSIRAKTWYTGQIMLAPRSAVNESVRNAVRDQADEFAADVQEARRARQPVARPSAAPSWRSDSEPRRSN